MGVFVVDVLRDGRASQKSEMGRDTGSVAHSVGCRFTPPRALPTGHDEALGDIRCAAPFVGLPPERELSYLSNLFSMRLYHLSLPRIILT